LENNSYDTRLVIEASNVHLGGGFVLLRYLLESLEQNSQPALVFLDARLYKKMPNYIHLDVNFVTPSIISRLRHYLRLPSKAIKGDLLLYFGNIPPFRRSSKFKSIVFLQNWFLICDRNQISAHSPLIYLRLIVERWLLARFSQNTDLFLVQSDSMKRQLKSVLPNVNVELAPFSQVPLVTEDERVDRYLYPSRADKSKNHRNLIYAWIELSKHKLFPHLILTIDPKVYPSLVNWINEVSARYNLNISNVGFLDTHDLDALYSTSPCVIFPSYFESYGLPLVEASALGLDIIAPELDYVRDVSFPVQTFDPNSPTSIARAVLRHRKINLPLITYSPDQFINILLTQYGDKNE